MKKILLPGLVAGLALLALSYGVLFLVIRIVPAMAEEYYNPIFWPGADRAFLFYLHPFILGLALAWFWNRFKEQLSASGTMRGIEMGLVYALVATLPSMWITFSAINVSLMMVLSWFVYGFVQAVIAGLVFTRLNP
ncbi:MAG: hypothetical protein KDD02_08920 [Phaeodactylibacter sp.]|nr:hypothetical protein [Phaeodactylibacter sp.]MCB9301644.1 hypothetical protein [Lewinellaceae bacterium]